jgi:hypothetical protein
MTKQIEKKNICNGEIPDKFLEYGYEVKSSENGSSVAWRIHEEKKYNVLELITYKSTTIKNVKEDSRLVSNFSRVLNHQFISKQNLFQGLELRRVFGVDVLYYMGKQVMVVADKFLVSLSRDERSTRSDSVEVVPISDLSSVLESRKGSVLKRAKEIFRPGKGEVLQKAYSRARKGLILTIALIALLVPLILLNATGAVFQILLTVDSALIIGTITLSLIVHELGVARFKKMLGEELTTFQELPGHLAIPKHVSRNSETLQEFPKQRIKPDSTNQPIISEEPPKELEIEKYVEPLLTAGENSSEFYAQRRDVLWDLAQKAYGESDWDNCTYHLIGAVNSALKEVYVKLSGKAAFGSPIEVAEFVCKKTGLNLKGFQQFFDGINTNQKLGEADLSRLFEHAQKLLTDLRSSASATATSKADSVEKDMVKDQKELSKNELRSFNMISTQRTEMKSSKMAKESGKRAKSKTGKRSVNKESEKLIAEPEVPKSGRVAVKTEAEVTNCDSVVETMCADDDIKNEVRRLFDSRDGKVDSAFLVVTQSSEVVSTVAGLKRKYPEMPLETYEHVVNGKAQIIVSRDGGISSKIDYESSRQLEKLILDHYRAKGSNELGTTESLDNFNDFLDE